MKLPSRKSATLLCGPGDSSSRRRRTTNFARLIGKRLWQGSSSVTAKSTSLLRLLYLQPRRHLPPPSTPPLATASLLTNLGLGEASGGHKSWSTTAKQQRKWQWRRRGKGRARDPQGASLGRRHWRRQRRCRNCWMATCLHPAVLHY